MGGDGKTKQREKKGVPVTSKRKIAVLSALVAVLAVIYILILVLDSISVRSDAFAWLERHLIVMADGIDISGPQGEISLSRKNNAWVFAAGPGEFPVKQSRVDDLFAVLSGRNIYPLRAASIEARQSLGLTEDNASRIRIRGGAGLPLLDLLVGGDDVMGREVYLRRAGTNQIYSGEDQFTSFINSRPSFWYDLRLFNAVNIDAVQQAEIAPPAGTAFFLRRSGGGWIIPGNDSQVDTLRVESWLRSVVEAEGGDFSTNPLYEIEGSITLWLADGTMKKLTAGPADEEGNRSAMVSGSSFVYYFPNRAISRLFIGAQYFIKN